MAGVNVTGQINFMFMVFINTLCASGGIFMSQYSGASDTDGMQQAFRFKIILCGTSGIIYMILSCSAPPALLELMVHGNTQSEEIVNQALIYMRSVAFSWVPMVFSQSIASSLRETGIVKPPLLISVSAALVNTFFNWVFIYGNLGSPRLEVAGVGIATNIARLFELFVFLLYAEKTRPQFLFKIGTVLCIKLRLFGTILSKSAMILVSEMTWSVSETIVTALYNTRGSADVVSGMAAGFAIANLFFVCFSGIFTSTGVIIGKLLGAGQLDQARTQKT